MKDLVARVVQIEQGQNEVVLTDAVAKELSLEVGDRVRVRAGGREIIAVVDHSEFYLTNEEVVLFYEAARNLGAREGQLVTIIPASPPLSTDSIRKKLDGYALTKHEVFDIINDLMAERLSNAELSAFITAIYINGLSPHETASLTQAIYSSGQVLSWKPRDVVSVHSIGGVAGDRTTMVVVPILASFGLTVPKTATRAISSSSGTVDAMEVLCPVALKYDEIKRVVNQTGACITWGGAVNLAVADDRLIKIRNPLRLDPEGLVLSSILAKKKAEGAKFVLLDIPMGRGAKIADFDKAKHLAKSFKTLAAHLGMELNAILTDGSQPTIDGIGPALEARAVLDVLSGRENGLLLEKSCMMAALVLQMTRGVTREDGYRMARQAVASGKALKKFREIIAAQGGDPSIRSVDIEVGKERVTLYADEAGRIAHIDNKNLSRIARALGAPTNKKAGILLHVRRGAKVRKGDKLYTLLASDKRNVKFALEQLDEYPLIEMDKLIFEQI